MKLGRKFNKLTVEEYIFCINNHKKYEDFNTLGLYRSIIENENLSIEDKIKVRDHAHGTFKKAFDFLQLKDPEIFVAVSTLGQVITKGDEEQIWKDIKKNQQLILSDKKIKHRNFGTYSKHYCPYPDCVWLGVMLPQKSRLSSSMHFINDKDSWPAKLKSKRIRTERKHKEQIIRRELDSI